MRISDVTTGIVGLEHAGDPSLEYRWLAHGPDGAPVADHRLTLAERDWFADSASFAQAVARGASPLDAATGWPARWTAETWPTILRAGSPAGRRLGVATLRPGLVLIERGIDADGATIVEHEAIVLAGAAVDPHRLRRPPARRAARARAASPGRLSHTRGRERG